MKANACPEDRCVRIEISTRKQYLEVLEKIRKLTQKIVIVQIDGPIKNDPIVNSARNMLHLEKKETVGRWYGTIARWNRGAVQYTFNTLRNRKEFFDLLSSFHSFWDGIETVAGCEYDPQAQWDDIAFLDDKGNLLFYSTTHEDDFFISKNLL